MMTGRAGTGIPPGAGRPGAHLPEHRPVRHADQVIVGLLLAGLATAAMWVLLVVAASAGGLGPHSPGPPAAPGPGTQPGPAPPGS